MRRKVSKHMTGPSISALGDAEELRAYLAQRIERLARRVDASTTTDVAALDAIYREVVRLHAVIRQGLYSDSTSTTQQQ